MSCNIVQEYIKPSYDREILEAYASSIPKSTHWFDTGCGYDSARLGYALEHNINPLLLSDNRSIHSLARNVADISILSTMAYTHDQVSSFCDSIQLELDEHGHAIVDIEQIQSDQQLLDNDVTPNHSFVIVRTVGDKIVRFDSYKYKYGGRVTDWSEWRTDMCSLANFDTFSQEWEHIFKVQPTLTGEKALRLDLTRHDGKITIHFSDEDKHFHTFKEQDQLRECILTYYPNMMNIGYHD